MSANYKWFVMMYSQNGEHVIPLVDANGDVMLWESEEEARSAAMENPFAEAFGFDTYEI